MSRSECGAERRFGCGTEYPQVMQSARWIWSDPEGRGRNRYVLFRRAFELPGEPLAGQLHLFADTRYRLMVNGRVLAHGPARFLPAKPEYDTIDLLPALRRGRNVVAILVNSCGGVTFHSEPSVGGLIAWGEARDTAGTTVSIATGESWRALESPGHRPDTHYMSFALNPAEQLDARAMPLGWELPDFDGSAWPHAALHAHPEHWGPLCPRSIPLLDESEARPAARLGAWLVRERADEEVHSLFVLAKGGKSLHTDARVAVMTFIHSPADQEITLGAWWGKYWANGEPLQPATRDFPHLREDFAARLRAGWNTFFMFETVKHDWWDFYLALPAGRGLALSAERQLDSPHTFLVGLWEDEQAKAAEAMAMPLASPDDLSAALRPWMLWPRGKKAETPCRERAWRTFERIPNDAEFALPEGANQDRLKAGLQTQDPLKGGLRTEDPVKGAVALLYDFGGEVLGRPVVEFTAAAGTVVDLAYTERLKADGTADVHQRFFVDMMERYIAREGRQTWQTFHPRGFRYLEVLIQGGLAAFALHKVALTRASYPVPCADREGEAPAEPSVPAPERLSGSFALPPAIAGDFECSDPVLNRVWALGPPTLRACMEDAYLDCPWRERGLYSGDFFVEFHSNLAVFGDTRLFRRCIELFFLSQGDNGLLRPCPHGLPPGRHPDYSALLAQCLWHYWAHTGDVGFLREMLPGLKRLLAGIEALGASGSELLDGTHLDAYIDLSAAARSGVNCALNCSFQRAFADGARILELAGDVELARHYAERAGRLAEAVRREFWDEGRGVFVDRLRSVVPDTGPSIPANALPLLYGIAECDQVLPALQWLIGAMRQNLRTAGQTGKPVATVSPYFSFYALGALYKHGRAAEAEEFMRTSWGWLLDRGAWTCWEHWPETDSLCHAWSSAPTYYLSSQALGIEFPEPGNPNVVRILPKVGTLQWAKGVYPHPKGPIRVAWRREGNLIHLEFECPDGVEVARAGKI